MLTKQLKSNWLVILILFTVMSIGIGTRYSLLESHFTHIDDIGVAKTILERQKYMTNVTSRYSNWRKQILSGEKGNNAQKIATFLDDLSILKQTAYFSLWWRNILHAVPSGWTYAPGQFYLTNLLINQEQNYSELKFWGRAPSLVFNVFALFLLILFFIKLYGLKEGLYMSVVPTVLLSFSWENIIYSAQMESYAVGSFSVVLTFLILLFIHKHPPDTNKRWFLVGVVSAIPGLFQYQALLFVPALYLALTLSLKNRFKTVDLFKYGLSSLFGFLFLFAILIWPYLKGSVDRGINWNAGPDSMFVLSPDWGLGFVNGLKELSHFLFEYFPEVINAMFSPLSYHESDLIGGIVIILSFVGVFSMLFSGDSNKKIVATFVLLALFSWFLALLLQKFPLSPTRHSIVLSCIILPTISEGLFVLVKAIKNRLINIGYKVSVLSLTVLWVFLFTTSISKVTNDRIDYFNEPNILKKIESDKVDVIVNFDSSNQLYLMKSVLSKYPALDSNLWMGGNTTLVDKARSATNYGLSDKHLVGRSNVRIAIFSGHSCFDYNRKANEIKALVERYGFYKNKTHVDLASQTCHKSNTEIEWSPKTQNGRNFYNYTVVSISKI